MKKQILFLSAQIIFCTTLFAQTANMGLRNDINGGIFLVNYERASENKSTGAKEVNGDIRFYNANFRFGGSLIGSKVFDEDSRFFIGDYIQFGLGMGIGKNNDTSDVYAGTTFNLMIGCNLGLAAAYAISEELAVGIKVIGIGGDLYFDFDENPLFVNGLTFHPTAQYGPFLVSAGFGGREKEGKRYKTLDLEARYNFSSDQEEGMYLSLRYQSNKYAEDDENGTYRYSQKISTVGLSFGAFF
ncbi:MAG: hypothetical protein ACO1O6_00670 [Bacteroidota bacterium]